MILGLLNVVPDSWLEDGQIVDGFAVYFGELFCGHFAHWGDEVVYRG